MVMDTAPETKLRVDRTARRHDRHGDLRRMLEDRRIARARRACAATSCIRSTTIDFIAGNGTAGLEILEDLPDVDAVVAPLGGGGLLAGIGAAMRARKPGVRDLCGRARDRGAARSCRSTRGEASYFDGWTAVVRRRRRRQVGAADDVAAAEGRWSTTRSSCRSTRSPRRCARPPSACTSSPKAPPACAIAAALSGRAGARQDRRRRLRRQHRPLPRFARTSSRRCSSTTMSEERFATAAPLPGRIHRLHELALDLWWSWTTARARCSAGSTTPLWRATAHNPVQMLQRITPERLAAAAADPDFLQAYDEAISGLDQARTVAHPWWREHAVDAQRRQHRLLLGRVRAAPVAADLRRRPRRAGRRSLQGSRRPRRAARRRRLHVSAGLLPPAHVERRLAGGTLRAHQLDRRADRSGASRPTASPCITAVPLGDRTVLAAVWRVRLGRVRLFLLDTDLAENAPWDRELSARLYGGDRETRIQQEIILGIGGVRVLRALGIKPTVWHLNEGHAAFVALQRIRELVEQGRSFDDALERSAAIDGVHDAHAGAGRPRRVPVPPGREAPGRLLGRDRPAPPAFPRARRVRQRQRPAVQHDGAGAAHRGARQRRQRAARRGDAHDVAADLARHARRSDCRCAASPTACTCRRGWRAGVRAARSALRPGLARSRRRRRRSGSGCNDIPDAEIWADAPVAARTTCSRSSASACARAGSQEHVGPEPRSSPAGAMLDPEALTHRLRAPLHRLQAARADLPRPRAAGAHPQRASIGRCRSCSPARRIRPTSRRSITCSGCSSTRSIRSSAAASPSSTTTTCTSRTTWCRAATCG